MRIIRKIETTSRGLVKATIKVRVGNKITRKSWVGYGLTIAEATAKAIEKLNQDIKKKTKISR